MLFCGCQAQSGLIKEDSDPSTIAVSVTPGIPDAAILGGNASCHLSEFQVSLTGWGCCNSGFGTVGEGPGGDIILSWRVCRGKGEMTLV